MCACSSVDRALVFGTRCRGFESLQARQSLFIYRFITTTYRRKAILSSLTREWLIYKEEKVTQRIQEEEQKFFEKRAKAVEEHTKSNPKLTELIRMHGRLVKMS